MTEVCPIIVGSDAAGVVVAGSEDAATLIAGDEVPAYHIIPVDTDFCNPSSIVALIFNGEAIFDGEFNFGAPPG